MADSNGFSRSTDLLLLEHDPGLRKSVRLTLERAGVTVWEAPDEDAARALLETRAPDILVLDHENMAEQLGELIEQYRGAVENSEGLVLITTGRRINDVWRRRYRPDGVVYKPFDVRFLCRRIQSLL